MYGFANVQQVQPARPISYNFPGCHCGDVERTDISATLFQTSVLLE